MERSGPDGPPIGGPLSFTDAVLPHLARARALGFVGPGPIEGQIAHAEGFVAAAGEPPSQFVDLGTGGGLPGLVLLAAWPRAQGVLLDSNERRTAFLAEVVAELGWEDRATVVRARAEEAGQDATLRGRMPLVVSRGFGPPPVVAECAAPLLSIGGRLIVSEPPDEEVDRWPPVPLRGLGMIVERSVVVPGGRFQVLKQAALCPPRYPRRVGIPSKRPLW